MGKEGEPAGFQSERFGGQGRLLVMGDIHGQYQKMERVLRLCGFRPEVDQLVLLGDYIDRGPESQRVVSEVIHLVKNGATALYGNHEDLMCRGLKNRHSGRVDSEDLELWFANGGEVTLKSYRAHGAELDDHLGFLSQLPRWVEKQGYLFVHAGIRPGRALLEQSPNDLIWIRDEYILGYQGDRDIVTGHTPTQYLSRYDLFSDVSDFSKPVIRKHQVFLDTGAAWGGYLSVMDLTSGEIWQA